MLSNEDQQLFNKFKETNDYTILSTLSKDGKANIVSSLVDSVVNGKVLSNKHIFIYNLLFPDIFKHYAEYNAEYNTLFNTSISSDILKNVGNSCYMDSVLVALLLVPNSFVNTHILYTDLFLRAKDNIVCGETATEDLDFRIEIQEALVDLAESLRGRKEIGSCIELKKLFMRCKYLMKFSTYEQHDSSEFLTSLLELFNTDASMCIESRTFNANNYNLSSYTKRVEFPYHSIIYNIKAGKSIQNPIIDRSDMSLKVNDVELDTITTLETFIVRGDYLIFQVDRADYTGVVRRDKVETPDIYIGNNRLRLTAVVIHTTRHYVAYIKINNDWYFYDDLGEHLEYVGSQQELVYRTPSIATDGTLYFYSI